MGHVLCVCVERLFCIRYKDHLILNPTSPFEVGVIVFLFIDEVTEVKGVPRVTQAV